MDKIDRLWMHELANEDFEKREKQRIDELKETEKHIDTTIENLRSITRSLRPKDLVHLTNIKVIAKKVLEELKKLDGAMKELRNEKLVENVDKLVTEFTDYYHYWYFIYEHEKTPGIFNFSMWKMLKFNVKTVVSVFTDMAKLSKMSIINLKNLLKKAHMKYDRNNIQYIKR